METTKKIGQAIFLEIANGTWNQEKEKQLKIALNKPSLNLRNLYERAANKCDNREILINYRKNVIQYEKKRLKRISQRRLELLYSIINQTLTEQRWHQILEKYDISQTTLEKDLKLRFYSRSGNERSIFEMEKNYHKVNDRRTDRILKDLYAPLTSRRAYFSLIDELLSTTDSSIKTKSNHYLEIDQVLRLLFYRYNHSDIEQNQSYNVKLHQIMNNLEKQMKTERTDHSEANLLFNNLYAAPHRNTIIPLEEQKLLADLVFLNLTSYHAWFPRMGVEIKKTKSRIESTNFNSLTNFTIYYYNSLSIDTKKQTKNPVKVKRK